MLGVFDAPEVLSHLVLGSVVVVVLAGELLLAVVAMSLSVFPRMCAEDEPYPGAAVGFGVGVGRV